jgi:hypothetical protein
MSNVLDVEEASTTGDSQLKICKLAKKEYA